MAYIKVDHSKFESAASAIDSYIGLMRRKMLSANAEIEYLHTGNWQGVDSSRFVEKWKRVMEDTSTYGQMIESLDSYAKFLRYAADKYKTAQTEAINRANSLPKF